RLLSVAVFVSNLLVCRGERDEEVPAQRVGRITGSYLSGSAALTAWAIGRRRREREELPRARWRCGFPRWPVFRWRARRGPAAAPRRRRGAAARRCVSPRPGWLPVRGLR